MQNRADHRRVSTGAVLGQGCALLPGHQGSFSALGGSQL